jgi:hypothetical protein
MVFPQLPASAELAPLLSARIQTAYYDRLDALGACDYRIAGSNELIFLDSTARYRARDCSSTTPAESGRQYYFTNPFLEEGYAFTAGLVPLWKEGTQALYAIDGPVPLINGIPRNTLSGSERANYAQFRPADLSGGLRLELHAKASTLLRVVLRCEEEAGAGTPTWRVVNGTAAGDPRQRSRFILGHRYHDSELALRPPAGTDALVLEAEHLPRRCDVSAIARTM